MRISSNPPKPTRPWIGFIIFTILSVLCIWGSLRLIDSGYLLTLYDRGNMRAYAAIGVPVVFVVGFILGYWSILFTEVLGFRPRKLYHYEGWPDGPTISIRFRV